jgi:hypothetical protein
MKLLTTKIALVLSVLLAFHFVNGQKKPNPGLIDSFSYNNSEDASARIDNWRIQLDQSPSNIGFIIIYGGKISKKGEAEAHFRGIKQALKLKGIDGKGVQIIKGGYREKVTIELWLLSEGFIFPQPTSTVGVKQVRFNGISRKIIPYECCF